jgi:peptidyl-prolyl cis-trans isomerase D
MAKEQRPRIVTKKHLARVERERRQQRIIMTGAIAVLVLALGLISYGILENTVIQPRQPVARVEDETISTREFQTLGRYYRQNFIQRYNETLQLAQMFGDDPSAEQYIQTTLSQIQAQLQPQLLGQMVLDSLIEDRLIRQEAARRGITVTAEEIDRALQEAFGYYASGTPTPLPTEAVLPTSTLSPAQIALLPPTPTITPTAVLTDTEVIEPEAEGEESEAVDELEAVEEPEAVEPTPTEAPVEDPTATPTAAPIPTATPYTFEAFQVQYRTVVDSYAANLNFGEADFRDLFESQLYREKVMEAVVGEIEKEAEHVWARHILVDDADLASELYERLALGEDFYTLAVENSTDGSASSGGDLGWFRYEDMVPEFSEAAFGLQIGEISPPVQSDYGWHIVQSLGREVRPISAATIENIRQQRFQEWLDQQRQSVDIEIYDLWIERVPSQPALPTF